MATTLRETPAITRKLAVGAELQPTGGTHFRVWAPKRRRVDVVLFNADGESTGKPLPLEAESDGYFSGLIPEADAGTLYKFRLDEGESFPDPASHFQPNGPQGASCVVDHNAFR